MGKALRDWAPVVFPSLVVGSAATLLWQHYWQQRREGGATAAAPATTVPNKKEEHAATATCCTTPEKRRVRVADRKKDPYDALPRRGAMSWDDYFMCVAFLSAQRSKDPWKQVGACIVGPDKVILGIGYNGFPRGCSDSQLPWAKRSHDGDRLKTKYPYVCHAEMNAIMNKNAASLRGATMFVTMFPCQDCTKLLIQAGIAEVVYYESKHAKPPQSPLKAPNRHGPLFDHDDHEHDPCCGGACGAHKHGGASEAKGSEVKATANGDKAPHKPDPTYEASVMMMQMANVKVRQHKCTDLGEQFTLQFYGCK